MAHRVAPEAENDLDQIWDYIARESGSLDIADRLIDSLTERFYLLSIHPHLGRRRDEELRAGIRSFPVGEYVILYRVENSDVLGCACCTDGATSKLCSATNQSAARAGHSRGHAG